MEAYDMKTVRTWDGWKFVLFSSYSL